MTKGYDKTFKQAYSKAVKLSERDQITVYVIRYLDGYRAVTDVDIMIEKGNRKPDIVKTVTPENM